jgi:hypothetical protein
MSRRAERQFTWIIAGTYTFAIPVIIELENNGTEAQPIIISGDLEGPDQFSISLE